MKQLNLTNNEFVVVRELIGSVTLGQIKQALEGSKIEFENDTQRVNEINTAIEKVSIDDLFTGKLYDKVNRTLDN